MPNEYPSISEPVGTQFHRRECSSIINVGLRSHWNLCSFWAMIRPSPTLSQTSSKISIASHRIALPRIRIISRSKEQHQHANSSICLELYLVPFLVALTRPFQFQFQSSILFASLYFLFLGIEKPNKVIACIIFRRYCERNIISILYDYRVDDVRPND